MLGAMLRGFVLGPVVLVLVALLWTKAAVVGWVVVAVIVALLGVGFIGAMTSKTAPAVRKPPTEPVRAGDATLTSLPGEVRATARENLASDNRWRGAFMAWRYGKPPGQQ